MTEREKKFLSDIVTSITLIEDFTHGMNSFTEYSKDLKAKGAVERHLGIIGEAVNKFLKESNTNELKNASQIVSLRNRLIHAYDSIDDSINLVNCDPTSTTIKGGDCQKAEVV